TSCSCDDLPDELLLVIFRSLSLSHLLKASRVSRRWHRLAFDKSLWYSVDLSKGSLPPGTIGQVLGAGVVVFRSPRSFLGNPNFKDDSPLCVQHMDLSHSVLSHSSISQILARCRHLLGLSLEGLALSDDVVRDIGHNEGLLRLNLSTCSHFSPHTLAQTLSHCPSDSTMLTASCLPALQRLSHLQHLGLSRCHEIPVAALVDLGEIATLKTLNIYGLLRDCAVNVKDIIPRININSFPLTTIARPTHGSGQTNTIWGMVCQLKLHSL
uniref:S-phase kinase-associated protein 2 n=1 Tax=Pristiophorus japonicus TaxID=55135 RepID=UPI00398EC64F